MTHLRIVSAHPEDLGRYLELPTEVADWLESKGIGHWQSGTSRGFEEYFAESIKQGEVYLASLDDELVGTLRLLPQDPIVWPEITDHDAVYVYNLAVRRSSNGQRLGRRMLEWAERRTAAMDRVYIRLDCLADNDFLRHYYDQAGFEERGEVDACYPDPVGTLRLRRFERRVQAET